MPGRLNHLHADYVPFVIQRLLVGVPEVVLRLAYRPPLFVRVLSFHRQVSDISDYILLDDLAVFVKGRFDDMTRLIHRTRRRPVRNSVPPILILGLFRLRASRLRRALSCSIAGLLSRFSSSVAGPFRGPFRSLSGFLSSLPGPLADLARGFSSLTGRLTGTFTNLVRGLTGLLCGVSGATTYLLGGLASAFSDVLGGVARTLGGLPRTGTNVLYR